MARRRQPIDINHHTAHASRVYDYLLGGTDNFPVDREAADHAFAAYPGGLDAARLDEYGSLHLRRHRSSVPYDTGRHPMREDGEAY
jgi:hypothetical protein